MSASGVCRTGSLCRPSDPLELLLEGLKSGRADAFRAALSEDGGADEAASADPNRVYGQPHFASLLDVACQRDRGGDFVRALLEAGANPDTRNEQREARAPLHFAARARNANALRELLGRGAPRKGGVADVNAVDAFGNNALHDLCQLEHCQQVADCLIVLLAQPDLKVNHTNRKGQTPIYVAATKKHQETVRTLLQRGVFVDVDKTFNKETARQVIERNFQDAFDELLKGIAQAEKDIQLMDFLIHWDVDGFLNFLNEKKVKNPEKLGIDADDGSFTLLQKAVKDGLTRAVEALLDNGANPNFTTSRQSILPVQFAARNGDSYILKLLLQKGSKITSKNGRTALHDVIEMANPDLSTFEKYRECFNILAEYKDDINSQDTTGNTPLHLAVKYGYEDFVLQLLNNGAYIGTKNKFGEPPIAEMSPNTLSKFLDSCVTSEKSPRDVDYKVMFDVKFLKPPDDTNTFCDNNSVKIPISDYQATTNTVECECEPLLYISKVKDLRPVLNHPVFKSFLEIKWRGIRPFFWVNLCFYMLFVTLLTIYILFYYESASMNDLNDLSADNEASPATLLKPPSENQLHNASDKDTGTTEVVNSTFFGKLIWIILTVLYALLVVRECFQLVVSLKHYFLSFENDLEVMLLVASGIVLFYQSAGVRTKPHLSAITILLSWAELVLLIGRHPKLSTNIEMLKTVSKNFLKFLAWYSLLIFAFALSFFSLFRSSSQEDNFFLDPGSSFFKTVVMVTGEFEAGELPFVMFPGTSHIVFVLFVFLVAIVLFNLLNGLAVSDTQAIREDAELVGIVSRINLVSYTEKILLSHPFWCQKCQNSDCCFFQAFACLQKLPVCSLTNQVRKVRLFPFVLPEGKIYVLPNQAGEIDFNPSDGKVSDNGACYTPLNCHYYLDVSVLKSANKILESQRNPPQNENCNHSDKIAILEAKLDDLNKSSQETQRMLQEILQLLENSHNSQIKVQLK